MKEGRSFIISKEAFENYRKDIADRQRRRKEAAQAEVEALRARVAELETAARDVLRGFATYRNGETLWPTDIDADTVAALRRLHALLAAPARVAKRKEAQMRGTE